MQKHVVGRYNVLAVFAVILVAACVYVLQQRPWSSPSLFHTPDETHVHQVYGSIALTQQVSLPTDSFDAIAFFLDTATQPQRDSQVMVHIKEEGSAENIRTVTSTYGALQEDNDRLFIPFEPITNAQGKIFTISIEAPSIPKSQALRLRYQSDAQKYPDGKSLSSLEAKQGNLGFVIYERPSIATHITRWLVDKRNISFWIGIGISLFALFGFFRRNGNADIPASSHVSFLQTITKRQIFLLLAASVLGTLLIWWPATKLFYFFDDVAILARAQQFSQTNPWQLLTAREYFANDPFARFALPHWRPLSGGIYPLVSIWLFGTNASLAFGLNLLFVGVTLAGLIVLGAVLFKQWQPGILAGIVWLVHSTKVDALYWWSSSQDVLASFFFIASLVTYMLWRSAPKKYVLILSLGLFVLGLLSKEHVIFLPLVLMGLEWMFAKDRKPLTSIIYFRPISYFVVIAGLFLCVRAIMLSDPTLALHNDPTYTLALDPAVITKNTVAFSAWTSEHRLWPSVLSVDRVLQPLLDPVRIEKPIYPGIVAIFLYTVALAIFWKRSAVRNHMVFAGAWWVIFLGPLLLVTHVWNDRWLYMSVYGLGILFALMWTGLPKKNTYLFGLVVLLLGSYGYWQARIPASSQLHREQSAYNEVALSQFIAQTDRITDDTHIILVGVAEHQKTSLTGYLFTLAARKDLPVIRSKTVPDTISQHDILIDMTGYDAYYPENDV